MSVGFASNQLPLIHSLSTSSPLFWAVNVAKRNSNQMCKYFSHFHIICFWQKNSICFYWLTFDASFFDIISIDFFSDQKKITQNKPMSDLEIIQYMAEMKNYWFLPTVSSFRGQITSEQFNSSLWNEFIISKNYRLEYFSLLSCDWRLLTNQRKLEQ